MAQKIAPQPRLLVNVVDEKAKVVPDSPWLLYANSTSWEQEGGYRTITWKQFANAVNKTAFWLDENLPLTTLRPQTFAYLGPNDARYYILMVAAAKSKRRMFVPDGRITPNGLAKILKEIQSTVWICTHDRPSTVPGQEVVVFPSLEDILAEDSALAYPYNETWEDSKDEIFCIIHTSGTTGVPKPIYLRNGFMSVQDSWNTIFTRHHPRKITYRHMVDAVSLTACAPQWLAGLAFSLNAAAFIGITTVMLPPDMNMTLPLDRKAIKKICEHTGAQSIITPPSLIEDFYTDEAAFDFLKSLKYVCWLGAALDHKVGDVLAQHTNLFPVIGSTERAAALSFECDDVSMWKSYEFVPEMGPRFECVADDIYELHIDRTPESDLFQAGFYTFPHLNTIATDELYSPVIDNGTKRWISRGRKDDLVKLSWLAKLHATHIEDAIVSHPSVASVIVGGDGRDVPYIIIEPKNHSEVGDPEKFIDKIYSTVIYGINEKDDNEIRIPQEMVMLSDPALPFQRTMKMTIMRKEVEKTYEDRIEALYAGWETNKMNGHAANCFKEEVIV